MVHTTFPLSADALDRLAQRRAKAKMGWYMHASVYLLVNLLLVTLSAGLALLLASVGLYAVMAVAVGARLHEFGVRAALGASRARLLRQVLGEAGRQIGLGLIIGLAIAMASSRLLQSFLFGIGVADPLAIAVVVLSLAAAGVLASLLPAIRASRVQPMQALRVD